MERRVHPALAGVVEAQRAVPRVHPATQGIEQRRAEFLRDPLAQWASPDAMVDTRDLSLTGRAGPIPARLYVPPTLHGRGLVVYFHGGSYVLGDLESHDGVCRRIAQHVGVRLLAIHYRRAPEHPFPAAVDDAIDATREAYRRRAELGDPDDPLVVMGDSAGATLATDVAAALAREPERPVGQVLFYPTLGPQLMTASAQEFRQGYGIDLDHLRYDYGQYLQGRDPMDPRVSPLFARNMGASAQAIMVIAACDPLRDEDVAYAGLLEHYGVRVELLEAEGMIHGFIRFGGTVPEVLAILDEVSEHLHRLLSPS